MVTKTPAGRTCAPFSVVIGGTDSLEDLRALALSEIDQIKDDKTKVEVTEEPATPGVAYAGMVHIERPEGVLDVHYSVKGRTLTVEVADKPLLLSCQQIEKAVRERMDEFSGTQPGEERHGEV